jgi:uncharacterized membrane protein YraQ (UPF0718 family)
MHIDTIALINWVITALSILAALISAGVASAWKQKLPAKWQGYVDFITEDRIKLWIADANNLKNKTGDERADWVADQIMEFVIDKLDDKIPHAIAKIIVKFVYDKIEDQLRK